MLGIEALQTYQIMETDGKLPVGTGLVNTAPSLGSGRITSMHLNGAVIEVAPAWPDDSGTPPESGALVNLTDAESRMLALTGLGAGQQQIARLTHTSLRTVERYQAACRDKLRARDLTHTMVQAVGTRVLRIANRPRVMPDLNHRAFSDDERRAILLDTLAGSPDAATARRRRTSPRTVQRRMDSALSAADLAGQTRPRLALQLLASGIVTIEELSEHRKTLYPASS